MQRHTKLPAADLDRRETQLTLFACIAIALFAFGTALFMYPVVFSRNFSSDKTLPVAYVGFCVLSVLLAGYLWDRQKTIRKLRQQVADERIQAFESQKQASIELLRTMPNFASFQDRLPMEYRRMIATTEHLSVLVITLKLPQNQLNSNTQLFMLGDAAKVISRKLRQQDSIYILASSCVGAVLPGLDLGSAKLVRDRIAEGLSDAAGASNRFSCDIEIVNYPADAASAHELERAVSALLPAVSDIHEMTRAVC